MDTLKTIEKEGYRLEDLPEKYQFGIKCMRLLAQDFEDNFEAEFHDVMSETVAAIKSEIVDWAKEEAVNWLRIQIAEYQIAMAEEDVQNETE